ncbi:MAG TPA: WbqC family protein [Chryseolinea sp.]
MIALIEAHYLPSIAYFAAISGAESILLERFEYFVKQSYRSRCRINTANGQLDLIVPVTSKHGKVIITDVRLDFNQKWLNNHWRTVQSAYGNAPFFEYYSDDLHEALFKKAGFLYELNFRLLSMCLKWLKWDMPVKETEYYTQRVPKGHLDLRSVVNPKKSDQCYEFYYPVMYNQVFGSTFVENLSLIDLIFCVGPGAGKVVRDSAIRKMNK